MLTSQDRTPNRKQRVKLTGAGFLIQKMTRFALASIERLPRSCAPVSVGLSFLLPSFLLGTIHCKTFYCEKMRASKFDSGESYELLSSFLRSWVANMKVMKRIFSAS